MKAEIITIGDELLIGQTANTNAQWMAQKLSDLGLQVLHITTISDELRWISQALEQAHKRADIVLVTGGLGPTRDDVTRKAISGFFKVDWKMHPEVYRRLENYLAERGYGVSELNKNQAMTPEGARVFINRVGTAPGMGLDKSGCRFYFMPGVPAEMRALMETHIIPDVKSQGGKNHFLYKIILTQGLPEAHLADKLKDFERRLPSAMMLAYLPEGGMVRLRLGCRGTDKARLQQELGQWLNELTGLIAPYIVHIGDEPLEALIGQLLNQHHWTLATGESCTGGAIAQRITSVSGSSRYYKGSVVAYSNEIKMRLLGVAASTLEQHGAVSKPVVMEMARGAIHAFQTDCAVAVSGIAGPTGGTPDKSVGTTWIAVASPEKTHAQVFHFGSHRELNIRKASNTALVLLKRLITHEI